MSALFTFKRIKAGRTHYVASVIPKTDVVDELTDDPAKAATFSEGDAKALWAALIRLKVYGRWAVLDAGGREVSVFTHATPVPVVVGPAVAELTDAHLSADSIPAADHFLADEPDTSPFRELADLFDSLDGSQTLAELAYIVIAEIKTLREELDELTAPPKDDDTAVIDTTTGPAK